MLTREPNQMPNLTSSPSRKLPADGMVPPSAQPLSEPFFPTPFTWEMRRRAYQPKPPDGLTERGYKVCPRCWRAVPVSTVREHLRRCRGPVDNQATPGSSGA